EAQLVPVVAFAPLAASRGGSDPGIVHQDVEAAMIGAHDVRKLAYRVDRGQIGRMEHCRAAAAADLLDDVAAAFAITTVHRHVGAGRSEPERNDASDAIRSTGNEEGLAGGIHDHQCSGFRGPLLGAFRYSDLFWLPDRARRYVPATTAHAATPATIPSSAA